MPSRKLALASVLALLPVLQEHNPLLAESYVLPLDETIVTRDISPDVCLRWSGQSAVINGTLYLYGGNVVTQQSQRSGTWSNDFYTLDLTKSWQISSPAITGLEQPSGPPAVALGYLWNTHDSLFLYGGLFSDNPPAQVTPYSMWEYSINGKTWTEHQNPTLSSGDSAPNDGAPVQRAAEGAGANVPSLGRGFYFGGHLDAYTTPGWSVQVPRLYLQSLLEFTLPGYPNKQVKALSDGRNAGSWGNYRNITQGGIQQTNGFTSRADGLLVHVPGFGSEGILIALAGGTNETFTQMNVVDVYDISASSWYRQSTAGQYPTVRVNPCAVVAAAADGSSYNIYMFGGQNLIPYGNQTQFQDMWILSIPSFIWISVDQSKQSVPYGRSGHVCNIWDGQMIMVGGYTGNSTGLTCETGIYTYDLSSLQWTQSFSAHTAGDSNNPFSQQQAQRAQAGNSNTSGLEGSYGYSVPDAVISVIGGGPTGGATLTTPVTTATAGPLATGRPVTYTVTDAGGIRTTTASSPGSTGGSSPTNNGSSGSGVNVGAVVAGVIAALFFLLACYLLFCTFVYRKRMQLYKRHAEMAQQQARGEKVPAFAGLLPTDRSESSSENKKKPAFAPWSGGNDRASRHTSGHTRYEGSGSAAASDHEVRRSGSSEDLLGDHEPTFVGVMLHPRRSLKVINHD